MKFYASCIVVYTHYFGVENSYSCLLVLWKSLMATDPATSEAATQTGFGPGGQSLGDTELFNYVEHTLNDEETFHYLGFEFLHRLNIVRIQNDLIAIREDMYRNRGRKFDKSNLDRLLNDYSAWLIWNRETFVF